MKEAREAYSGAMADLEKLELTSKGKEILGLVKDNFGIVQNAHDRVLELITQTT